MPVHDAEIHVVSADHPAEEQVQPLAGAARRRPREEVADARPLTAASVDGPHVDREGPPAERFERRADVRRRRDRRPRGRTARSTRTARACCRSTKSSATMSSPRVQRWTNDAKRGASSAARTRARTGGFRAEQREHRLDGLVDGRDAPESERRRAEAGDLAVGGRVKRRTRFTGSAIASAWLNSRYMRSSRRRAAAVRRSASARRRVGRDAASRRSGAHGCRAASARRPALRTR